MRDDINVSNYLGSYDKSVEYKKFDFVFSDLDGIFYYAKENVHASENDSPSEDPANWSSDSFFFDPDYGSSVSFSCHNIKHEYDDGYYIYQPKGVNSIKIEFSLQFKNRTNKESNAIIHFLESHLGQYQKDRPSFNLKYNQGIQGFYWDQMSRFHPYLSSGMAQKKFYCLSYSHSLNFENSNDLNIKITNMDTSLMAKSESLFIDKAADYNNDTDYQKNNIVFFPDNKKFYYYKSDISIKEKPPAQSKNAWSRDGGFYEDINLDYWTRDFLWRPSLTMKVDVSPRVKILSLNNNYSQVHRDGINEKLINLDLDFNNRGDHECAAILHFLEQHYGCRPFRVELPAPYEKKRNFVCQSWSHVYNYKQNHSIKIKLEEFPFKLSPEKYDGLVTEPDIKESEFIMPSKIYIEDPFSDIGFNNFFRKRVFFKNVGDQDLSINSMSISANFGIVGKSASKPVILVVDKNSDNNYFVTLDEDSTLPFELSGKTIQIFKRYTNGVAGGINFCTVSLNENGKYERDPVSQEDDRLNAYFQNNLGTIVDLISGQVSRTYKGYVDAKFFTDNTFLHDGGPLLPAGETGYIDIYYQGDVDEDDFNYIIENLDFLSFAQKHNAFGGTLNLAVKYPSGLISPFSSSVTVDLRSY